MDASDVIFIKQHLIDPEICIRCNTCEATCPVSAITHDGNNYVVDAASATCAWLACRLARPAASTTGAPCCARQGLFGRGAVRLGVAAGSAVGGGTGRSRRRRGSRARTAAGAGGAGRHRAGETTFRSADYGATLPPWSAAHAFTNLYGPKARSSP